MALGGATVQAQEKKKVKKFWFALIDRRLSKAGGSWSITKNSNFAEVESAGSSSVTTLSGDQ